MQQHTLTLYACVSPSGSSDMTNSSQAAENPRWCSLCFIFSPVFFISSQAGEVNKLFSASFSFTCVQAVRTKHDWVLFVSLFCQVVHLMNVRISCRNRKARNSFGPSSQQSNRTERLHKNKNFRATKLHRNKNRRQNKMRSAVT